MRAKLLGILNDFQNFDSNDKVTSFTLDRCVSVEMHFHHIGIELPVGIFDFFGCSVAYF